MLTDEMLNELEQITREYVALCEYNEALFDLHFAAAKLGKSLPEDTADLEDETDRLALLRNRMLILQHECLKAIGGKIRIPSGIYHSNIINLKVEDGRLVFEKPMDAVELYRLIKAGTDAELLP